ncbi:zf-HC2 domain-containing protein [Actinomadura sp. NPDC047616]|uniref:anti-sigma factor family protein n=1 Tax=Actinomadura sp. NPDC047616 TaxID=3155914 RepID=UPI0033EB7FBC
MSCLGERLTALVDGELGHDERDRALAHLAVCARCRAEAEALRGLKSRLRGLADPPAAEGADDLPTGDFLARLKELGRPPQAAPGPDDLPPPSRPSGDVTPAPAGRRGGDRVSGRSHRPFAGPARTRRHAAVTAAAFAADPVGWPGRPGPARSPRRRYLAVGAALFLGLGTASYLAGGEQDAPTVNPAFDRFAVEHALTSGDVPITDPLLQQAVQTSPGP